MLAKARPQVREDEEEASTEKERGDELMLRIPEMVPVSYPKRTPPKATKKPMAMAGHALPGSSPGLTRDTRRSIPMMAGCDV